MLQSVEKKPQVPTLRWTFHYVTLNVL